MESLKSKRIEQIDIARGIAAICMILGHSFIVYPIDISSIGWCSTLHTWIYSFHMELFFFLTGAVWYRTSMLGYIKKKTMRILIPYVAFGVCSIIIRSLDIGVVNNKESIRDGLINLFFYGGAYWFLYVTLFMYILYPVIDYVLKKWKMADEWILGLALCLVVIGGFIKLPTLFMIDSVVYYFPFFMLGKYLFRRGNFLCRRKMPIIFTEGIFGVIMYAILSGIYSFFPFVPVQQARAVVMIFALLCFVEVIVWVKKEKESVVSLIANFVNECGRYTLQLYLFNGYLLVIIRVILVNIMKIQIPVVIVTVITVGNLIITLCLCKWILSKIPGIRVLCGL